MGDHRAGSETHHGNWYVLVAGMPAPSRPLVLAPGVSIRPLGSELSVFDLAAAGSVGFREWATLEPIAAECVCEIESAKDSDTTPGYDTLNRAWLASAMLVLRGFSQHLCLATSSYSWSTIAGHQTRTSDVFKEQLVREGVDAAVGVQHDPSGSVRHPGRAHLRSL